MTTLPSITFLWDIFEYNDLRCSELLDNGASNFGPFNIGGTNMDLSVINYQQNVFKIDRLTNFYL